MIFKIILYFILDILFYGIMITSTTTLGFYTFYLLMGLSVLLTAFNISHDAAHGVAVKSKFWNKLLFSLSFNLQGNNAYVWGKNHNESHHLYTNVERSDIDVLNNPLLRMTESQPLKWYHRFQYLYAPLLSLLYSINWFFIRETLMLFKYSSRTIKIEINTMFKKFLLSLFIALGATQLTQAQITCDMMSLIVNVSDTDLVKLYHPGHYLTSPKSENVIVWEITDSHGIIIAEDTLINNSDFLFYHTIPLTDTMNVTALLTNDSARIACLIKDQLYWKVTTIGTSVLGRWQFVHGNVGVDVTKTTGIAENQSQTNVSVYPNPSNGQFQFTVDGSHVAKNCKMEIYNVLGERIYKFDITNTKSDIDLSNQTNGIYFVKIYTGQTILTKRIVKQ
jgi:hypothetical protein